MTDDIKKIPVVMLTGFLGSGKTTLLNHILRSNEHKLRIAVIENEYAIAFGIENELIEDESIRGEHSHDNELYDELYEFGNGCVCCSMRGEFIQALNRLAQRKDQFDLVLVELTGMADPTPLSALFADEFLAQHFRLDGVVAVVDSVYFEKQMEHSKASAERAAASSGANIKNEAVSQVVAADVILLNKQDLVTSEHSERLQRLLTQLNPIAHIVPTQHSKLPLDQLFNISGTATERALALGEVAPSIHDDSINSIVVTSKGFIDKQRLRQWLNDLVSSKASDILRVKGVVYCQHDQSICVIQGVHELVEWQQGRPLTTSELGSATNDNRLVVIGYGLDRASLQQQFVQLTQK